MVRALEGKVAVVAGATRGAGRGIACMLGDAGATVYCTGRSVRGEPSPVHRPETIEETAEMVTARGGLGIWVQVDHTRPEQVEALFERVKQEQNGRLDILVNDLSGDALLTPGKIAGTAQRVFWKFPLEKGLQAQQDAITAHIITSHYGARLMVEHRQGLIVEINDGNYLLYSDCGFYYSLTKTSAVLLAYFMAEELRDYNVAAVCLTPGYLLSEKMLENEGVTQEIWQDASRKVGGFSRSETPFYIGRAVVALASDLNIMKKTGRALSVGCLAREYGFTDMDGRQPVWYQGEGVFNDGDFTVQRREKFKN